MPALVALAEGPGAPVVAAPSGMTAPVAIGLSGTASAAPGSPAPAAVGIAAPVGTSGTSTLSPLTAPTTAPQTGLPPVIGEKGTAPAPPPLADSAAPNQVKDVAPATKDGKTPATSAVTNGAGEAADISASEKQFSASDDFTVTRPQPFSVGALRQFGYSFFRPESQGFAPLTDVPVSPDYILGAGDRISLTLWGSIEGSYDLEISRSGEIVLPKVGAVKVAGITFEQLPGFLNGQLSKIFRDFQLNVTMGKLRLIKVYLVGEVKSPGDYNVSSLATLINALAAAGGPTKQGTLRAIQVIRAGKNVETVDLYDFFLKGDKSRDIRLQPGDTINVPIHGNLVGIGGNIRKPGIYEFLKETTLKELFDIAGGVPPSSYLQRIQLSRVVANDKKLVEDFSFDPKLSGKAFEAKAEEIKLRDMDLVKIMPIDLTVRDQVRLEGYVLRPGGYALKPGMRVKDLIGTDNLLPEYYPDTVEITRLMPPDFHPEKTYVNLDRAMQGDEKDNILLSEFDAVRIYSRFEMEEMPFVSISGEVLRPGTYRLNKNARVVDLVKEGGNLKRKGYAKKVEIRRLRYEQNLIVPYSVYINLEEAFKGDPTQNILLEPFDEVVVRKWDHDYTRVVRISGEVQRPGEYRLVDGMTIADLVIGAGNIKKTAYLKNAEILRLKITSDKVTSYPINVSLEEALNGNAEANLPLQDMDEVMIRRLPEWMEETERYVSLRGEVMFPGTYPIFKGEKLSSVLRRAGGFSPKAYLYGSKFTRTQVRELQQKRMEEFTSAAEIELNSKMAELTSTASTPEELASAKGTIESLRRNLQLLKASKAEGRMVIRLDIPDRFANSPYDIELMGGDVLEVPQRTNSVSVLGRVYNPTSFIFMEGASVGRYLDLAGGMTRDSDEDEIYVVRADGSIFGRQQYSSMASLFGYGFMGENLHSGDVIVVPQKFEKTAWMRNFKDITTIMSQIAITAGTVLLGLR